MTDNDTSRAWLADLASEKFNPVCIELDRQNRVLTVDGRPEDYGLLRPEKSHPISQYFDFAFGLDEQQDLELGFIEMPNGRAAHAQLKANSNGKTLVIIDATLERDHRQALQQKSNELRLLTNKQEALLEKIKITNAALDKKKQEAEKLSSLQSQFLASMSHEFRTPLASIVAYSAYLATADGKVSIEESIFAIERAAKHLLNLVENLIGHAQFTLDDVGLTETVTAMTELCSDFETIFLPLAKNKGLRLCVNITDSVPTHVRVDAIRLRQMIINLLANACKYTNQGTVVLSIDWRDNEMIIEIADTGIGISQAVQKDIFKAFERGSAESGEGAGLGLYITKRLADLMGGRIAIDSDVGQGTTVTLTLPLLAVERAELATMDPVGQAILVVEDDSDVYDILAIFLDDAGFEVYHADNGQTALEMFAQIEPHAVITDLNVPDGDGISLTQTLREFGYEGPIIILTASNSLRDREKAQKAGCSSYVVKPINPAKLVELIAQSTGSH